MKKSVLLAAVGVASLFAANQAAAQDIDLNAPCGDNYYTTKSQNWFVELGAGIDVPFVENAQHRDYRHITASYGGAFGKWFSPYFAWRFEVFGGSLHYNATRPIMNHAKMVSGNVDIMWDLFNSLGGVNSKRVVSLIPFVGLGYTYAWDYKPVTGINMVSTKGPRTNESLFPVSAGLQLRFRVSSVVDIFAQARLQAYGDNFNGLCEGKPVDLNLTALAGLTFNIGGSDFNSFNPCDYNAYINSLNDQVNELRGALATTAAALAVAESQLPCPEVEVQETAVVEEVVAPLLSTVRFKINSATISNEEKVNVYNMAQWLKNNPDQNVVITGYADKDTGTSAYNMKLSQRRAEAVAKMLTKEYGIDANRIATAAEGSNVQLYPVNNWNRIVVFSAE